MTRASDNHKTNPGAGYDFAIGDELRGERATLGKSLLDVQRDLRIKAAYIAAIENADPAVFPNPSFVPGYVRSYARYLGLDAEEVYARFCAESGFDGPGAGGKSGSRAAAAGGAGVFRPDFILAERRWTGLPAVPVAAIGSVAVLALLVAGLGYGGWTVLQNIQRVQFAPVEEIPTALAAVEAVPAPTATSPVAAEMSELARPVAAAALADLYRQQETEVSILVPRDGPIAAIDPDSFGLLAGRAPSAPATVAEARGVSLPDAALVSAAASLADPSPAPTPATPPTGPVALAAAGPAAVPGTPGAAVVASASDVVVVAERAAWIRVYLADKTVLFERILETGETYAPPAGSAPMIWAGNSGSVYVKIGDKLHGPLGSGTKAVRDVVLDPTTLAEQFQVVDRVPDSIAQALAAPIEQASVAME